ncbi:MAG: M56 family metallopeptidase [Ruminococcus sp.]|nr:M56 family metallopeptidase [Ruminococcus sp.]
MSLLQMSFTGAVLIMVIVVIRAVTIHRLPKKTFSVLWLLVIFRLLLPISVPSPLSIYSLVNGNNQEVSDTTVVHENKQTIFPVVTEKIHNNYVVSSVPQELPAESSVSVWTVIWFIGMLLFAVLFSISYIRCKREFRTAITVKNTFISEWLDTHNLKRKIEIRQFSGISTPMTYGLFRPVILLPENMDLNDRQNLQYILYHEFVHIRHYDVILKILATTALCVHWFNPFVWVMYILFNRDTELACDECVIKHFGREKRSVYAGMLISMEERKNIFAPFCNNFSKNAIEERIESIMRIKKKSVLTMALACTLVIGTAGVFATSVQADKEEESTKTVEDTVVADSDTEYTKIFNPSDWWTYEEYAEWLENEKTELHNIIGEKAWTASRGDFVWTEEIVEETIQMYEEILEDIKNGAMYSKSDDDDMIVINDTDTENTIVERDVVAEYYDTPEQISDTDIFKVYEPFGLVYNSDNDTLTFNGKLVRWFEDYYTIDGDNVVGIVSKFDANGVIDVYAVRDFTDLERHSDGSYDPSGKLIGLKECSQEEFDSRDINAIFYYGIIKNSVWTMK